MRPTLARLVTRPIPVSAIPSHALRLPPTPAPRPNLDASSPTLDRLVKSPLPSNLRVNDYVPKRKEFHGVARTHRDLVRPRAPSPLSARALDLLD